MKKQELPSTKKHVAVGKYPGNTQSSRNSAEIAMRSKRIKVSLPKISLTKSKEDN